jgi:hypothetical protein
MGEERQERWKIDEVSSSNCWMDQNEDWKSNEEGDNQ